MATVIRAPYPALAEEIILPNPELGDEINNIAAVNVITMQDGSIRTITRNTGKKERRLSFSASDRSAEEAALFIYKYSADKWVVNGTIYWYVGTTLDLTYNRRAANAVSNEDVTFSISLREA